MFQKPRANPVLSDRAAGKARRKPEDLDPAGIAQQAVAFESAEPPLSPLGRVPYPDSDIF